MDAPIVLMRVVEFGSTGTVSTGVFQILFAGNPGQLPICWAWLAAGRKYAAATSRNNGHAHWRTEFVTDMNSPRELRGVRGDGRKTCSGKRLRARARWSSRAPGKGSREGTRLRASGCRPVGGNSKGLCSRSTAGDPQGFTDFIRRQK